MTERDARAASLASAGARPGTSGVAPERPRGVDGVHGARGANGVFGDSAANGANGARGAKGARGDSAADRADRADGADGADGADRADRADRADAAGGADAGYLADAAHGTSADRENPGDVPLRRPVGARDLVVALALAAVGAVGLVPGARGEPDPLAALVWIALVAPAAGYAARVLRLAPWPVAPVVPVAWILLVALSDAASARDLPAPAWAALPVAGLFGLGYGLARVRPAFAWRGVAVLFLATVALALPSLAGLVARRALPPRAAALALDASTVTLVAECAGVDWLRHPPVYEGASTSDLDPTARAPYDRRLAGVVVFVVGCAAASIRRRTRRAG